MAASFVGKDYRLVGRSVLGEQEDDTTYYWNEFNLETATGEAATLVYEETPRGGEWRIFTLFDPEYPMTAAAAASMSVGDRLNLTGDEVSVTFRSFSEVYYIEGKPPEGEAMGKVAEYFNAESGSLMQVVSWTGAEVEYYNGVTLTAGMVRSAFGLAESPGRERSQILSSVSSFGSSGSGSGSGNYISGWKFAVQAGFVMILFLVIFGRGFSGSLDHEAQPVKRTPAAAQPLEVGATGTLFDKNYRVTAHAVMEVAEVGANWERHEYELTDDSGAKALLICGDQPDAAEWILFEPFSPMAALTAKQAAAKQLGDLVELDGYTGKVGEMFLSTIEQTDGEGLAGLKNGTLSYGFCSANEYRRLLCRWNDAGIQYFRGRTITARKGAAAFASARGEAAK
jgi:hypothetical protein